jgi:hypothetical protein
VAKPEGYRPRGGDGRRAEDNIKMEFKIGVEVFTYICVLWDKDKRWAVVNTVMNFLVP